MRLTAEAVQFLKRYRQFREGVEADMKRRFERSYPRKETS
jgi:hypothetical protein